jgi:hypothetical protein
VQKSLLEMRSRHCFRLNVCHQGDHTSVAAQTGQISPCEAFRAGRQRFHRDVIRPAHALPLHPQQLLSTLDVERADEQHAVEPARAISQSDIAE